VGGQDFPIAADLLQNAGRDTAPLDDFALLGFDAVIVRFGGQRDGTLEPDVDLIVGEFERLEMAKLGAEMLGQIIGVAALDTAAAEVGRKGAPDD